ncbi:LuxR C-terminal-related transcriptional regulator [Micromonospora sp. NBC_01699]|uniref:helix-turn-helix transcriptional regulator n=1 Tax=Micromonospora sp. NBC_01699 TaxID=2975984 RepID=UPI002E27C6FE|nr:LuxR C-terminal-related transcriptional regulator [Micromonospora sp. NBC_01699]
MMPVAMVGRVGELTELARAWSSLAGSVTPARRTVVITGAAGVGKSLLVAAALDGFADPRPSVVLFGTARVHSPAPYDWLAAVLSGRDTAGLPLPADALAWLAQHPNAPRERYAPGTLLRLAVATVRALVGAGPAVIVVEDLHALDPASLNLIGELAAAPELPALLVVASRPPETALAPELAARTLARLTGAPGAVRQHLGALTADQVAAVLAQVYPDGTVERHLVEAVRERTGGNPYRLTELLATRGGHGPDGLLGEPPPEHPRLSAEPIGAELVGAELTAREIEVLGCLAAGMSNKQVARSLGISVRTVTVHVSNLLRKTGSASRTEAALWAVRRQLTGPTQSV